MNWPAYPEYKASGVDWLGDVPAGWTMDRLKHGFNRVNRSYSVDAETVTAFRDGEVTRRSNRRTDGFTEADKYIGYQGINPGDLAIHAMDGFAGAIGVSDSAGKCSPVVSVCSAKADANPYFYAHILRHIARSGYLTAIAKGVRERSTDFRWADAQGLLVPFPPASEQQCIADFLDRETAKIDALIDKQNQLIATLREDRTATITHAVTEGLNPNAEVQDSGVEWLGHLPVHWKVGRVKDIVAAVSSGTSVNGTDVPAGTGELGVLKTSCVSSGTFVASANKLVTPEEFHRVSCPVRGDTLIVNRANTPALVGSAGYSPEPIDDLYLSDKLWQVTFTRSLAKFVYYWSRTPVYRSQIAAGCVGASASMQNLSISDFRATAISLPPVREQREIVVYLDDVLSKVDALLEKASDVVATLREYRSALITAAVTGKIDVREAA